MSGETIDGGAPYNFEKVRNLVEGFNMGEVGDWKDDLQPAVESDEKGFFVEPGGEGDVQTVDSYQQKDLAAVRQDDPDPTPEEMDVMVDKAVSLMTEQRGVNPPGSPSRLNKRSVLMVLEDYPRNNEDVAFVYTDGDGEDKDRYTTSFEMWDDLGRPDTITVVVYPRDMFN